MTLRAFASVACLLMFSGCSEAPVDEASEGSPATTPSTSPPPADSAAPSEDAGSPDAETGPGEAKLPKIRRARIATMAPLSANNTSTVCRIGADERVRCYGGTLKPAVEMPGLGPVVALAGGAESICALDSAGHVWCWGHVTVDGVGTMKSTPVQVAGITGADAITAGYDQHCARVTGGQWLCWGANGKGQLGDGTTANRSTPVVVPIPKDAIAVTHGAYHGCYALASGVVRCTGLNDQGQLGDGTNTDRTSYVDVHDTLAGVRELDASRCANCAVGSQSAGRTSCAVLASGAVKCWGGNLKNALGDGSGVAQSVPVTTKVISNVAQLSLGGLSTCAVDAIGKVTCWGEKAVIGAAGASDGVATVVLASGVAEVSSSRLFSCALLTSGGVSCWGPSGPLGSGQVPFLPQDIPGL